MKRIVLTGGGTAGHVTPNIALIPRLKKLGYEISYIGSYEGIEKKLISDYDIPYYGVSTGKLRRYIDPKNLSDPFRVVKGLAEARKILKDIRPDVIFSKGGFVSVPVVRAAGELHIPCIIHESDMTPGLANKLCIPVAKKVCCNFPETVEKLPAGKAVLTGTPIREELLKGSKEAAYELCGFTKDKPVLMVIGGSSGSVIINKEIRTSLPKLLKDFQVVHLCGTGRVDNLLLTQPGYKQFEYLKGDLKDVLAMADIVVSRAGANAICELLALKKPNLLIPLSKAASRGDQILNAASFEAQGYSLVLQEEDMDTFSLTSKIHELYETRDKYIETMTASSQGNAIDIVLGLIEEYSSSTIKVKK